MKYLTLLALFTTSALIAADKPAASAVPAPASPTVTANANREAVYKSDIAPIMEKSCISCHGKDGKKPKGGFNATTLTGLVKGGNEEGDGITWGDAEKSSLYTLSHLGITDRSAEKAMPPKKSKSPVLTADQLAKIKAWIEAK